MLTTAKLNRLQTVTFRRSALHSCFRKTTSLLVLAKQIQNMFCANCAKLLKQENL